MGKELRFLLNGQTINLLSVGIEMDKSFMSLYSSFSSSIPFNWDEFDRVVKQFLKKHRNRSEIHDKYFSNFSPLWNNYLSAGNYNYAGKIWQIALKPVIEYENANPNKEIHKGTAYYFWGITNILKGDIDTGYLLFHKALDEDIKTTGDPYPNTPAYALACINFNKQDQAFKEWVFLQAQFLDSYIQNYSIQNNRNFSISDFWKKFLDSKPNTDVVFLFSYSIARFVHLSSIGTENFKSVFCEQLILNIFSDITLIIEATAKIKNPTGSSYINHAEYISTISQYPISNNKLGEVNKLFQNNFNETLQLCIDGSLHLSDGNTFNRIQSDILISYGLRNKGAHDLSPSKTIINNFDKILESLFNILFLIVDYAF
jgi:hypothetical protein